MRILTHVTTGAIVLCSLTGFVPRAHAQVMVEGAQIGVTEELALPGLLRGRGPMKTGTGQIAGRVLSADGTAPLRRAQVRIMGADVGVRTALTDTDGRYEFKELPAGRFTISASKAGYVSVQYGQTRAFESGRPIELSDKQVLDKIDIAMPRGGVITGRILDEFGEPVADAMVMSMRQTWANGRRRLQPSGRSAQTNDLGQYRLYGLPPGEYYVSATFRNTEAMAADFGFASGAAAPAGSQPASGYAPTYFPGTSAPGSAQSIAVAIGQEAQNADFALLPVRLARITGSIVSSDGKPVEGAMVTAAPLNRSGDGGLPFMMGAAGRSTKDGQFSISNVAPGEYTLTVRSLRIITSSDGGDNMVAFRANVAGMDGSDAEMASLPIVVAGEDLTNVVVVTSKGGTASGRIVFEGGSTPPNMTGVRISAAPAESDGPMFGGSGSTAKADGAFELKGLSGRRLIRVANLPSGWTLKAVRLNGEDITDSGAEFRGGQETTMLEIVATNKLTTINGTVASSGGGPVKDYTVVIFSEDPQHWQLPLTRWVTGTRPNQEGRFEVRHLPAGRYYGVAVSYIEQGAWGDPELLERLKTRATGFTLADGGTETLELKLVDQF